MAEDLLLPEAERLPDLSQVRQFTEAQMRGWLDQAEVAFWWGPDERNGCHRVRWLPEARTGDWVPDSESRLGPATAPDQWTPARVWSHTDAGLRNPQPIYAADFSPGLAQPTGLVETGAHSTGRALVASLQWESAREVPHRAHAPAALFVTGCREWAWHGCEASGPLARLLDAAWEDLELPDAAALSLLTAAEQVEAPEDLKVAPHVWVAHVLAANPSPHLSPNTRAWCHLLAQ